MKALRGTQLGAVAVTGVLMVGGVAACGGSSKAAATGSTATATASPAPVSGAPGSGRAGGGFANSAQFTQIEQCLKAAGIAVPTARPRGSFRPSGSARPSFVRPTGTARPSGFAGRGGGGFGAAFQNPQAQAALKACGIAIPSFRARGSGAPGQAQGSPAA